MSGHPSAFRSATTTPSPYPGSRRMPASLDTFVKRPVAAVAIELVVAAGRRPAHRQRVLDHLTTREVLRRVVEQEEVEAPVAVVVQKDGVRREARVGDAVLAAASVNVRLPLLMNSSFARCSGFDHSGPDTET